MQPFVGSLCSAMAGFSYGNRIRALGHDRKWLDGKTELREGPVADREPAAQATIPSECGCAWLR